MTQIWTNSYIAFSSDKLISSIVDISKAIKHGGTAYDVNGLAEIDLSGEKIGGTVDFYPATRPFTYNSSDGLPDQRISDFSFYDKFSAYTYGIHDVYIKFDDLKTLDTRAKVISFFFGGDDIVDGTHRNDVISGYNGNDSIDGYKGNDKLYGGAGDDYLSGWEGNDTLVGGTGNDHLHGGDGKDTFVFNTSLKSANVDSVFDFKHSDDVFQLDHAVFAGLKVGNLSKDAFKVIENIHSTKNVDSNDRILYDKANDDIYFDRDGSGTHDKPVKFVEVIDINDVAKINYTDFHIV